MSEYHQNIHQKAIRCAKEYRRCEAALIEVILLVWSNRIFEKMKYTSLHSYCVQELGLSEGSTYGFIQVAKKSQQIPELKKAIDQEEISVSQARRIVPVLNDEKPSEQNQQWIDKAKKLTQKNLEKEVAKANPKTKIQEKIKPVAESLSELRCAVTPEVEEKIRRAQDLLSQKRKKACELGETLAEMVELFLDREDPLRKAQRSQEKASQSISASRIKKSAANKKIRTTLPATTRHQLQLRATGHCEFHQDGKRCHQARWLEIHHLKPISQGGTNALNNLILLCKQHHSWQHPENIAFKV